jgi:hypothetical protein
MSPATASASATSTEFITRKYPRCIATISAGFEKGDFLVREEKGQRVYFDFFEEAFNYIAAKGYSRMPKSEEGEWIDLMVSVDYDFILVGGHISQCVGRGGMKML